MQESKPEIMIGVDLANGNDSRSLIITGNDMDTVQISLPARVAAPANIVLLDRLLLEKAATVTITAGDSTTINGNHCGCVKVDYPYIVMEVLTGDSTGKSEDTGHRAPALEDKFTWCQARFEVVGVRLPYFVCEFIGITGKLEKQIARTKRRQKTGSRLIHGKGKRKKGKVARK
jgi:hypothetical protein